MARTVDSTTIEVPIPLRDLIASHRLHSRQALHEVIEEAVLAWMERGAWAGLHGPWNVLPYTARSDPTALMHNGRIPEAAPLPP